MIWQPDPTRASGARINVLRDRFGAADFVALHEVSVRDPGEFWRAVWSECGVLGDPGDVAFDAGDGTMRGACFFTEARLNFAENLLGPVDDSVAIVATDESGRRRELSRRELHVLVARIAAAMTAEGLRPGDRVAAWMANIPETVAIMLAAASIGAVFSSTSPDFGVAGVIDRFGQIEPVLLFAVDGYRYGGKPFDCMARLGEIAAQLPSVRRVVVVRHLDEGGAVADRAVELDDWLPTTPPVAIEHAQLPFDHPLAILYSSGTTGPPKCIVHRAGGILLKHLSEHQLHCDVRAGERVFYFTTCGWMMWNWLASALASHATIVLYDGSPFHPHPNVLFDLVARERVTLFGVSAKYIDACRKEGVRPRDTHDLSSVVTICSTGSPLVVESFEYVWDAVSPQAHLASISGGTDLCGCLVMGDPTRPVYAGEIQGPALGVAADVWTGDGEPAPVGQTGELVCTRPFPSMPLGFWGDPDGRRYQAAYFERFQAEPQIRGRGATKERPDAVRAERASERPRGRERSERGWRSGVWAHGDFAARTEHGGFVISGRSDATLNPGGVRIGTAEIYRQVEALPEVAEALAIGRETEAGDTEIVLFVRLSDPNTTGEARPRAAPVDYELARRIRERLRIRCSPRHVPAAIVAVVDLPRTRSGKLAELAVADMVAGRTVRNREALANPEALDQFADLTDLLG